MHETREKDSDRHGRPQDKGKKQGPRFKLDIEGTLYDWDRPTIMTEEIAQLGGWDSAQGVILIDKDNNERMLQPGEVVELKPGMGFSKKIHFRRGDLVGARLAQEVELLRQRFPEVELRDRWIRLPNYCLPEQWNPTTIEVALFVRDGYPGVGPYGIYVPTGLRVGGTTPQNYTEPAQMQPPFGGTWGVLSWEASGWRATADLSSGHNLLNWVLGARSRFREGA